jgi:hypothetical protein
VIAVRKLSSDWLASRLICTGARDFQLNFKDSCHTRVVTYLSSVSRVHRDFFFG